MDHKFVRLISKEKTTENYINSYEKEHGLIGDSDRILVVVPLNTHIIVCSFENMIDADIFAYNNHGVILSIEDTKTKE